MRIIHTSDLHLDSSLTSSLSSEKAKIRKRELLSNLRRLFEEAVRLSADALIIAGDLFDSERVSERAVDTAIDTISSFPKISVFYLTGNHEKDALASSGKALPENLFLFGGEWTYFKAGEVVIAGRSCCCADMFDTLSFKKGEKNIAVLHGELRDRSSAPNIIGIRDAADKNIGYLALGHYHGYKSYSLGNRGAAVYSGTPEGRGFDECGRCGFVLIDTDAPSGIKYEFIPFAKRSILIEKADITGISGFGQLLSLCAETVADIPKEDILRIELVGERERGLWIDTAVLEEKLSGGFFHLEVKNSSSLSVKLEDCLFDKSLKGEFVRKVYEKEGLDGDIANMIIEMGLAALAGEDI